MSSNLNSDLLRFHCALIHLHFGVSQDIFSPLLFQISMHHLKDLLTIFIFETLLIFLYLFSCCHLRFTKTICSNFQRTAMNYWKKNVVVKENIKICVEFSIWKMRSLSFVSNIQYHERRLLNEYYKKKLMPRSASKYAAVPVLKKNKKSLKHHCLCKYWSYKRKAFIVKLLQKRRKYEKKP